MPLQWKNIPLKSGPPLPLIQSTVRALGHLTELDGRKAVKTEICIFVFSQWYCEFSLNAFNYCE